jgi:hypothetical protein
MLSESMEVIFRDWRESKLRPAGPIQGSASKRISGNLLGMKYLRVRVELASRFQTSRGGPTGNSAIAWVQKLLLGLQMLVLLFTKPSVSL